MAPRRLPVVMSLLVERWNVEVRFDHPKIKRCACSKAAVFVAPCAGTDKDGRRRIAVNLRLTEPGPIEAVPIRRFDGFETWEDLPMDGDA